MNAITSSSLRRLASAAVVATLGATLGAALLAGPAAAQTAVFSDAKGDVDVGADIWRVRVVNDDQVRVKVVHRNLVRSFRSGSSLSIFFDTDRHRRGPEYVFQGGTYEGTNYALLPAEGWRAAVGHAEPMRCGYVMRLDYVRNTALVRIDRGCLGDPGAVRVEVKTGGEHVAAPGQPPTTQVDWLGRPRQFTSWVRRG